MKPIIRVNNISKQYQLGAKQVQTTFREDVAAVFRWPLDVITRKHRARPTTQTMWALRDLTFDIMPGDVVGVIGRNGAGKSTLLKMLSRITAPTTGRIELYGRVGSLLEVGTGFHPELTGRENIYLNGAILGMKRSEIDRKFDEIVAFAEVEAFLDTAVKHYSSGMYMRLAFSVAAHLEPEILIVDEVLAVGDISFQKKCLGKMGEVARGGRTVLFVSHNMAAVEALCNRCLWLSSGELVKSGPPASVVAKYVKSDSDLTAARCELTDHGGRRKGSESYMTEVNLMDGSGHPASVFRTFDSLRVNVAFSEFSKGHQPFLSVVIKTRLGVPVVGFSNRYLEADIPKSCEGSLTCFIDSLPLVPGSYTIDLLLGDEYYEQDVIYDAIGFDIAATDIFGTGKLPEPGTGAVCLPARFEFSPEPVKTERQPLAMLSPQ